MALILALSAHSVSADTYLLVRFQLKGDKVSLPSWLAGYRLAPISGGFHGDRVALHSYRHWKLDDELSLLRIKPKRFVLDHVDFGPWRSTNVPDLYFGQGIVLKIRRGAVHFPGDFVLSEDNIENVWRSRSLLEACQKFPEIIQTRRFIVVRADSNTDLDIADPCSTERLEAKEIE